LIETSACVAVLWFGQKHSIAAVNQTVTSRTCMQFNQTFAFVIIVLLIEQSTVYIHGKLHRPSQWYIRK
jgi:hypothetical protein